jgi:SAM-dependent methyltransferase
MDFRNDYEDAQRAATYAELEFPGTYGLAFRDIPEILRRHARGLRALDFGCGAGRSTRFLAGLGYHPIGIDISGEMLRRAREFDRAGDYRLIEDGGIFPFADGAFDIAIAAFTFDNIPTWEKKVGLFRELRRVLAPEGRLLNLVSTPEIYLHEWASFSTKAFPENRNARTGDPVLIINTATADARPVADIFWPDEDYREVYKRTGLELLEARKLMARPDEDFPWVNETRIAPWCLYVLRPEPIP